MKIGLIGDYKETSPSHQAIPKAFQMVSEKFKYKIEYEWIPTEKIQNHSQLRQYDGLWCVPGSPYRSMEGALLAIQYAREHNIPFLGTCGGFQHAIIEYARNVLGWQQAEHAETAPEASQLVISPLKCALAGKTNTIHFVPKTKIMQAYGHKEAEEGYRCRFGLNPEFENALFNSAQLQIGARDDSGEIRAIELKNHPFFIGTLFQPELVALKGELPPLVIAFIQAIVAKQSKP